MTPTAGQSGRGAIPFPGGVTFRVWAPFASAVSVAGEFNRWSETANPLAREENGCWSVDVPGASIGQAYKFFVGNASWKIDPYAKKVTSSVGNALVTSPEYTWRNDDFSMPPWNELVIYQLHVGTFPDTPPDRPGMLDAVIDELWYLEALGINAIQLLPAAEFPTDISWGYNPAHIFAVESAYGGPDALKRFVDAAHGRGIAVFLDVVYNHFGPTDLDLWQFDGWYQRWHGEPMGGIYFYNDWRSYTPWGKKNRPDYGRAEVRRFILDNVRMWLDEYRVDGLRFDSTVNIRNVYGHNGDPGNDLPDGWRLLQSINDGINARQPWKISIAEDMQQNEWLTKDTGSGGAGFDVQWDAGFVHPVRHALITPRDEDRDMYAVRDAIVRRYNADAFQRVIYVESHDEVARKNGKRRLCDAIQPGRADSWHAMKRSTLGAALVFTAPGIPMIFQGQELLAWRPFGDDFRIDWDNFCDLDVASCPDGCATCEPNGRFYGIFLLFRDLIRLRRNWYDNTRGLRGHQANVFHLNQHAKLLAFHRWDRGGPGDDVVVAANFSHRGYDSYRIGLPRAGRWKVRFNSDWQGYSPIFGDHLSYDTLANAGAKDGMPANANIGIGPYSAVVLSQ